MGRPTGARGRADGDAGSRDGNAERIGGWHLDSGQTDGRPDDGRHAVADANPAAHAGADTHAHASAEWGRSIGVARTRTGLATERVDEPASVAR